MEAVQRGMAQGRRRVGVVLGLLLFVLLASGSVGYLIRYATAPAPSSTTRTVPHVAAQAGNPAGDRWWQDTTGSAAASAPSGDHWWADPQFAPSTAAATPHHSDRVRTY